MDKNIIDTKSLCIGLTVCIGGKPVTVKSPEALYSIMARNVRCVGIPITEGFLTENGFVLRGKTYILKIHGNEITARPDRGVFRFHITGEPLHDGFLCPTASDNYRFVHELQNACLLCRTKVDWKFPDA